ncbi:glycosyltransferase [Heliobacterium gestii]|uniref:cellulose synthase (UDP-forming) n=1 Tax=Heliomicrobium gestii TaxID=2699 RepID=A0A845LGJ9_HELGE|nr:glycosyltransferase family 2 protein [Heliomicrobium gestii]MBM7868517.1 cellulose synthase (UDP-forming) [Heliomicrobium gestii]MZP44671.1 glycosyltransferase [Heliomicrobium gestii]
MEKQGKRDYRRYGMTALVIAANISSWLYLGWRTAETLPDSGVALIWGSLLLISEWIQAGQSVVFYSLSLHPSRREPPALPLQPPAVDVFVATYNEPKHILRSTVAGCRNLEYPEEQLRIWLCDDDRREEVRQLAEEMGVGYFSRRTNEDAKAGNLNNALGHTQGELIVTLDADMIPRPEFLQRTVGFFTDEKLAFVQAPQAFYNQDIFQYNLLQGWNIPNEQDMFMRVVQAGRDRHNAAMYIGSNTVFRRSALAAIGGFATGTITEDMATGMLLQAKGYRTIYLNEILAEGLSAESFSDYIRQRIRWARGNVQTARKWNPLTVPGLTVAQRLLYGDSVLYWYSGLFKLTFILSPLAYLLLGIPVMQTDVQGILTFWLPQFVLSAICFRLCTGKMRDIFWSNIYETAVAPAVLRAVLGETLFGKGAKFEVTPKGVTGQRHFFHRRLAAPHLILLMLSLAGLLVGSYRLYEGGGGEAGAILVNLFWAIYNVGGLSGAVLLAWEPPRMREKERFERSYQAALTVSTSGERTHSFEAVTLDISESGCCLLLRQAQPLPAHVGVDIFGGEHHTLQGRVVYCDNHPRGYRVAIAFEPMEKPVFQLWIREVYGKKPKEAFPSMGNRFGWLDLFPRYISHLLLRRLPKRQQTGRLRVMGAFQREREAAGERR